MLTTIRAYAPEAPPTIFRFGFVGRAPDGRIPRVSPDATFPDDLENCPPTFAKALSTRHFGDGEPAAYPVAGGSACQPVSPYVSAQAFPDLT